ncbi:MAG: response regulator, partial [Arenimonas sp.]|uniref:response regulator n=1 Tax=Arenimonas sp. TaxID=1872635 RepID=UPI0025C6FFDA
FCGAAGRGRTAGTLAAARRLADPGQALWLFDAHLPDGHGGALLRELRQDGLRVPALALTADDQPQAHEQLRRDGFLSVLTKPASCQALQRAVRGWLQAPGIGTIDGEARWDDPMALTALGGSPEAVQSLRALFLAELPAQAADIAAALADGDPARAQAQLHRLKASCSYVGAAPLLQAVQALSRAPGDAAAQAVFQWQAGAFAR